MTRVGRLFTAILAGGAVLSASLIAVAEPRDLIGVRAGQGESSLRNRGYSFDHSDGGVQYWWHSGNRECINLFVSDGRYDAIDRRPSSECNYSRGGGGKKDNSGAVVAGALAIGILAAAAASKNRDHDRDRDRRRDDDRRDEPAYSPARGVDCYPRQRACYERGRGYSSYWTSREFNYRY